MKIDKPQIEPYFAGSWQSWDGETWVLISDWEAFIRTDSFKFDLFVKAGFTTDFGSIPKFYRPRVNRMGKGIVAFLPHDCGYAGELKLLNKNARADWDWLMLEMLEWVGFGWSRRNACYLAVKAGGWKVWMEHTEESVEKARGFISIADLNLTE